MEKVRRKFAYLWSLENVRRLSSSLWKICDDGFLYVGKCATVTNSPILWWKMCDGLKKSNSYGKCATAIAQNPQQCFYLSENVRRSQIVQYCNGKCPTAVAQNPEQRFYLLENVRRSQIVKYSNGKCATAIIQNQLKHFYLLENVRRSQIFLYCDGKCQMVMSHKI